MNARRAVLNSQFSRNRLRGPPTRRERALPIHMKIQSKKLAFWRRFIQSPLHAQYCQYRSTYLHRIGREFEDGEMFLVSQMLVCMYKSLISNLGCAAEFDKPPNLISRRTFLLLQPSHHDHCSWQRTAFIFISSIISLPCKQRQHSSSHQVVKKQKY